MDSDQTPGHTPWGAWIDEAADPLDTGGAVTQLGDRHRATFVDRGPTLLVSFESAQSGPPLVPSGHAEGPDLMRRFGWSHLGVTSDGDTWFRDEAVFAHFDGLTDDGFFDAFDTILFYGAGPCGYAAAAFSVAAPGARVLALQPQATLDPGIAGWDTRFAKMRRTSFADRYGYAPDMLDAAAAAFVVFDPRQTEDAMHAALFTRPNATMLRARHFGGRLHADFLRMGILDQLMVAAARDRLTRAEFGRLLRARRDDMPYLRHLLRQLDRDTRPRRIEMLCRSVVRRHTAPRFARRLDQFAEPASA
ncbi:phosphoadenosine phosphosulfate reductase [Roseobacter sinensis]|uniref:Phosphoadenosine phosphosulfate reductase n=1 Tax=Roseobacter sinensis TaxID=2931391 RepID=A0ABT3BFT1_9RHOB|nr:phosphoadenosine phosphosulfate reductase [Roseobacter sp. WL0113]MCV3272413.1 phosphoadenosine phosphosulfate reductase [Roseobacter sp. WL0113]